MNHKNSLLSLFFMLSASHGSSMIAMEPNRKNTHEIMKFNKEQIHAMKVLNLGPQQMDWVLREGLIIATSAGDIDLVKQFINLKFDVAVKDRNNDTALHIACGEGHFEIVKFLIANGAEINSKNILQITPFLFACDRGHSRIVSYLLATKKINLTYVNEDKKTALNCACISNRNEVAKILIEHKSPINTPDKYGTTPLLNACINRNTRMVELLLLAGADPNAHDNDLATPLHAACQLNQFDIAQLLIAKKACLDAKKADGYSPIQSSCYSGDFKLVQLLGENGANVNSTMPNLCTPLHQASHGGYLKIIEYLCKKGAHINAQTDSQWAPIHTALMLCKKNTLDTVTLLIKLGADKEIKGDGGTTPLHLAVLCDHISTLTYLLKIAGVNANPETVNGITPLNIAYACQNIPAIMLLLEHNAHVNTQEKNKEVEQFFTQLNQEKKVNNDPQPSIERGKNFKKNQQRKLKAQQKKQAALDAIDETNNQPIDITPIAVVEEVPTITGTVISPTTIELPTTSPTPVNTKSSVELQEKKPSVVSPKKVVVAQKESTTSAHTVKSINSDNVYQILMHAHLEWPQSITKTSKERLLEGLRGLKYWPDTNGLDITSLKGHPDISRLRTGEYRILFSIDNTKREIRIHKVALRKSVYKNMRFDLK